MIDLIAYGLAGFILYTYFGYPFLLWLITRGKSNAQAKEMAEVPSIEVLIAAYNEESCITDTIRSILDSDYPADKLSIWIVSDASEDSTDAMARDFSSDRVRLLRQPSRSGKVAALRRVQSETSADILVLADASSRFQKSCIARLAAHFADATVGCVSGSKKIRSSGSAAASGDGLYWRYEAALRGLESRMGSCLVGCEGGVFAIRRSLLDLQFPDAWAEDYAIGCRVFEKGSRCKYDSTALVEEPASRNLREEFRRKVRVIVRGIHAFFGFMRLWKHLEFAFQNCSHRLFRWLVPFALLGLLICSEFSRAPFLRGLFCGQLLFYALGLLAWAIPKTSRIRLLSVPYYFLTVNAAAVVGWGTLFRRYTLWDRSEREP